MKIKIKIFAITIALIMVTGVTTIMVSHSITGNMLEDGVSPHLESTAQSRADHIETVLTGYKELTEMLAAGNPFRDVVDEDKEYTWRMEQVNRRIKSVIPSHCQQTRHQSLWWCS